MRNSIRFGISLPEDLLKEFDEKIEKEMYANRSEAIRDLIRRSLVEEKWEDPNEEVIGTVTLVYDHEKKGISDKLTDLEHAELPSVISTMHVHLDEHNCMETVAIKGKAKEVEKIAHRLISTKGVKHGDLVRTAV